MLPSQGISYQVVVGEPRDLLLHAVLHLGLRRQGRRVVEHLLLLLDVVSEQLDLSVEGLQLVLVLSRLSLQLGLEQPERRSTTVTMWDDCSRELSPAALVCCLRRPKLHCICNTIRKNLNLDGRYTHFYKRLFDQLAAATDTLVHFTIDNEGKSLPLTCQYYATKVAIYYFDAEEKVRKQNK